MHASKIFSIIPNNHIGKKPPLHLPSKTARCLIDQPNNDENLGRA